MKKPLFLLGIVVSIFVAALLLFKNEGVKERILNNTISSSLFEEKDGPSLLNQYKNGDLIFHTSLSDQSKAIQIATKSKYSHCGIIYEINNAYYVFEAVQPVKLTPLKAWIKRGKEEHFVVKRLIDADMILTPEVLEKMKNEGELFLGKNYDLTFEWSDEKIYCSELIWKIYQRAAGIEIGETQQLKDFDLSKKTVKQIMNTRYGNNIPYDETVISPAAIFHSPLLETIASN
jgi:hypothetical protein